MGTLFRTERTKRVHTFHSPKMRIEVFFGIVVIVALHGVRGDAVDVGSAAADQNGEQPDQKATAAKLKRMDDTLAELKTKVSHLEERAADDPGAQANKRRIEDDPNIYDSIAELKKSQAAADTKINSVSTKVTNVRSR